MQVLAMLVLVVLVLILPVLVLLFPVLLVLRPRFRRVRVAWEVSGWWWSHLVYKKHEY
jgi:hypothetical protein